MNSTKMQIMITEMQKIEVKNIWDQTPSFKTNEMILISQQIS